jgi:hypothetical protein
MVTTMDDEKLRERAAWIDEQIELAEQGRAPRQKAAGAFLALAATHGRKRRIGAPAARQSSVSFFAAK